MNGTLENELRTAADWCRQRPQGPERDAMLTALAERAAVKDPALAAELAPLLQESTTPWV